MAWIRKIEDHCVQVILRLDYTIERSIARLDCRLGPDVKMLHALISGEVKANKNVSTPSERGEKAIPRKQVPSKISDRKRSSLV